MRGIENNMPVFTFCKHIYRWKCININYAMALNGDIMPIEYRINIRLSPEAYRALDEYAKGLFISKAAAIRLAVGKMLGENGGVPAGQAGTGLGETPLSIDGVQNDK